jgi:hypothetical protein
MSTQKKLVAAQRAVELLRLTAEGADESQLEIWQAGHLVADLETVQAQSAVAVARRAALVMDVVLAVVAVLTMGFSLDNIHGFAVANSVQDPIAWFLAPAIDLALCAALLGDAVLSRWQLDAGPWATRLRWYTAGATLALNTWSAWVSLNPARIVLHSVPPVLLFILAEAASPYRERFAETVRLAAQKAAEDALASVQAPERTSAPVAAAEPVEDPLGDSYASIPTEVKADQDAAYADLENAQVAPRTLTFAAQSSRPRRTVVRAAKVAASETARAAYENAAELEVERKEARAAYERSVTDGKPLGASALGRLYGKSEGWGRKQIAAARAAQSV